MTAHLWVALAATWLGAAEEDLGRLQGTWQRVAAVVDGQELPQAAVKKQLLLIEGTGYKLKTAEGSREGVFEIRPTKTPKEIDIKSASGPNKGKVLKGIYELDGDTFKYCVAPPGKDRPTELSSKPGSGHMLYTNKKIKP